MDCKCDSEMDLLDNDDWDEDFYHCTNCGRMCKYNRLDKEEIWIEPQMLTHFGYTW